MKALSIRQPWAWLILHAGKDIENREWPTRFRGRVAIHAGKGMTQDEYDSALIFAPCPDAVNVPASKDLPRGGIIGSVEITDCITRSASPWFCGKYGFVLRNPRPLVFRPYRGQLGFFDVMRPEISACPVCEDRKTTPAPPSVCSVPAGDKLIQLYVKCPVCDAEGKKVIAPANMDEEPRIEAILAWNYRLPDLDHDIDIFF